jgi:hypothetical protein
VNFIIKMATELITRYQIIKCCVLIVIQRKLDRGFRVCLYGIQNEG